ncbi:D-alanyl-D-alanine carboxypeptidase [Microbacterium sp. NPDC091662]|uniref:D-alanyl-D-alanine carboxypeptidase family protein n=1 Tax=Microbacterium sp. NPDC091662 TaxID=3364211 RepID=UPI0038290A96
MTASDPADEATGVVSDDGPATAAPSGPVDTATGGSVLTAEQTSTHAPESIVAPEPVIAPEPVLTPEPAAPPLTKPPFVPRERVTPETSDEALALLDSTAPQWADDTAPATALTWVDTTAVAAHTSVATLDETSEAERSNGLLRDARLRPAIARPGILVPLATLVGLVAAYAGTTLLWPLHEVPPTVQSVEFTTTPAAAATVTWPTEGAGAVGIAGMTTAASVPDAVSIASITKVVSSLMVLDRMPLAVGEQGPEFSFTRADSVKYWDYRRSDQSALDVPIGGVLTEYQLLQGTLMGSANNYIDRLATEIWGSDREFARAAEVWLRERGLTGITVVTPSGFDERNVATPEALVTLGERAMQNPVFAEIVGTKSVDLPGAGTVVNTNGMLDDPGVVGIKTGTLVGWNLLTAKDVVIGDTTVHLFAAALNQAGNEQRLALTRSLFTEAEAALEAQAPAVAKDTVVGRVTTPWGEKVDVITESDAEVVLWNGATATAAAAFDLGDAREQDDAVGTLTTTGPLNTVTTPLVLAEDVEGPSPWWRLTHPLELLGITADRS